MKLRFLVLSALGAAALAAPVQARPQLGPDVEAYFPFSGKTRDRFGSSFTGIGLGSGGVVPSAGGKLRPDFALLSQSKGGNRAFFVIAGLQYRRTFDPQPDAAARYVPYYGAGVDAIFGKVRVPDENRDGSGLGAGASAFVGTSVGRTAFLEARVRGLSSVESFNFSGLSLAAGLRF